MLGSSDQNIKSELFPAFDLKVDVGPGGKEINIKMDKHLQSLTFGVGAGATWSCSISMFDPIWGELEQKSGYITTHNDLEVLFAKIGKIGSKVKFRFGHRILKPVNQNAAKGLMSPWIKGLLTVVTPEFTMNGSSWSMEILPLHTTMTQIARKQGWVSPTRTATHASSIDGSPILTYRQIALEILKRAKFKEYHVEASSNEPPNEQALNQQGITDMKFLTESIIPHLTPPGSKEVFRLTIEPFSNSVFIGTDSYNRTRVSNKLKESRGGLPTTRSYTIFRNFFGEVISWKVSNLAQLAIQGGTTKEVSIHTGDSQTKESSYVDALPIGSGDDLSDTGSVFISIHGRKKAEAHSRYIQLRNHLILQGDLVIVGDPTVRLFEFVDIIVAMPDGTNQVTSGIYQVLGIEHRITGGSFETTLKVVRQAAKQNTADRLKVLNVSVDQLSLLPAALRALVLSGKKTYREAVGDLIAGTINKERRVATTNNIRTSLAIVKSMDAGIADSIKESVEESAQDFADSVKAEAVGAELEKSITQMATDLANDMLSYADGESPAEQLGAMFDAEAEEAMASAISSLVNGTIVDSVSPLTSNSVSSIVSKVNSTKVKSHIGNMIKKAVEDVKVGASLSELSNTLNLDINSTTLASIKGATGLSISADLASSVSGVIQEKIGSTKLPDSLNLASSMGAIIDVSAFDAVGAAVAKAVELGASPDITGLVKPKVLDFLNTTGVLAASSSLKFTNSLTLNSVYSNDTVGLHLSSTVTETTNKYLHATDLYDVAANIDENTSQEDLDLILEAIDQKLNGMDSSAMAAITNTAVSADVNRSLRLDIPNIVPSGFGLDLGAKISSLVSGTLSPLTKRLPNLGGISNTIDRAINKAVAKAVDAVDIVPNIPFNIGNVNDITNSLVGYVDGMINTKIGDAIGTSPSSSVLKALGGVSGNISGGIRSTVTGLLNNSANPKIASFLNQIPSIGNKDAILGSVLGSANPDLGVFINTAMDGDIQSALVGSMSDAVNLSIRDAIEKDAAEVVESLARSFVDTKVNKLSKREKELWKKFGF